MNMNMNMNMNTNVMWDKWQQLFIFDGFVIFGRQW